MRTILLCAALALSSCSSSDSSPEVLAQAMSYSGNVPTFTAKGEVAGSQFVGTQHRTTMLHQ